MLNTRDANGECRFGISKELGDVGEEVIRDFLGFYFKVPMTQVQDMRDDLQSRQEDVDFIVWKNNKPIKIEVKTDSYYKTGNIAFEYYSSMEDKSMGCLLKTTADFIFYYFPGNNTLVVLKTQAFRAYVLPRIERGMYRSRQVPNRTGYGTSYHSLCYLIPIRELQAQNCPPFCTIHKVI